ncbi:Putative RNA helicase (Fragment) [Rhizopus microsporus]
MIDTKLPLQCVKHNVITEIQYAVDFTDVSEGGCNKPCGEKLRCGHECLLKCHPYDHDDVLCRHPCGKMLKCRHPCPNYCFQHCGPCTQVISVRLPCGDTIEESCSKIRTMAKNPERHRCPTCNSPLSVK